MAGTVTATQATLTATKPAGTAVNTLVASTDPASSGIDVTSSGSTYTIVISNLTPGQSYTVTAYFVAGSEQSAPVTASVTTSKFCSMTSALGSSVTYFCSRANVTHT